jgi:hypothetical protein
VEGERGCPRCWGHTEKKRARAAPHGAGVRGSAQHPHMAPRPARCGGLRQQIVAVLREHSEGLSPKAVQTLLQSDKDVRSTMKGMVHRGLLTRLAAGRYVVRRTGGTLSQARPQETDGAPWRCPGVLAPPTLATRTCAPRRSRGQAGGRRPPPHPHCGRSAHRPLGAERPHPPGGAAGRRRHPYTRAAVSLQRL